MEGSLCPLTDVCVVLLTEGVKFRVLCEEPGTALHLMMEVRRCVLVYMVNDRKSGT